MKVQLHEDLKTIDGKDISVNGESATVGSIASKALLNSNSEGYEKKVGLAKKILQAEGEIDLKTEEITTIKNAVKQMPYTAQMVYQFEQAIDPVEDDE